MTARGILKGWGMGWGGGVEWGRIAFPTIFEFLLLLTDFSQLYDMTPPPPPPNSEGKQNKNMGRAPQTTPNISTRNTEKAGIPLRKNKIKNIYLQVFHKIQFFFL